MAAVTALYHLKNKEDAQNQAIERISSGLRLNHALDDAAGASIVSRMTSQIKGLEAAMRNAADAISLTQTAEGALDEVSSILHRMRELSVQAANGVYTGQDRQAIQNEVGQIQIELARIAQNSTFNAVKMLNGDFTNTAFQIGFQPNDTAILSIENVDPTGLGEYLTKSDQLRNASATFMPAAAPIVANDKASFQPRMQETENLTIYGNVGNVTIDINGGSTAKEIAELFAEVIIAPEISDEAKAVFAAKKNLRVLETGALPNPNATGMTVRSLAGGYLLQTRDAALTADELIVVTKRAPTDAEMNDLLFAFTVCKHVKSNAIIYVKNSATVGVGAGQMSRVNSSRIAAWKAADAARVAGDAKSWAIGSVVASDAFFPFADGLIAAADAGATAIIQPGGSMRDEEVIAAADEKGLAMVFTSMRHFRH